MEETSLGEDHVVARAEYPEWVAYEWPVEVMRDHGRDGRRRGQVQRWFLFDALSPDVEPRPDGSEFVAWQWVEPEWLIDHVPDWRQGVPRYRRVLDRRPAGSVHLVTDLFSAAAEQHLRAQAPLAARLRPRTLDDVVGQDHLVGPDRPLRRLVEQDRLTSAIFWGPPGTGKTTLALAVAGSTRRAFEQMSAVTAGVKDVREVIERARQRLGEHGRGTILFLDEIHRFSKSQQDALLPAVEDGTLTLIGATTENPFFEVNPPLRSRSTLFRLEPLDKARDRDAGPPRLAGRGHDRQRRGHPAPRRSSGRRRAPGADRARGGLRAGDARARSSCTTSRRRSAPARCATDATTTTTSSARSSRACAAATRRPRSTTWRGCSRPARTPASSLAG